MDQTIMDLSEIIARHSERKLQEEIVCRENIVDIINRINKKWHKNGHPISTNWQVDNITRKEKTATEVFFAKSIHAVPNWAMYETRKDRSSLENIPEKADSLIRTLTSKKSGKPYQLLMPYQESRDWFHLIALISASIRTLYWMHEDNKFTDEETSARVGMILTLRETKAAIAKSAGHSKKHEENAQLAIAPIIETYQHNITDASFPPYTRELPPLPHGIVLPIDPVIRLITGER